MQRYTQWSYNKCEFTNLSQTETALHSRLQGFAGKNHAECSEGSLPQNNCDRNYNDRYCIFNNHCRIDHHPHRYKENCAKKIFHRLHQPVNRFRFDCFCQNRPHDKRTECSREPCIGCHHYHTETQCQWYDKQSFLSHQFPATLQKLRNQIDAYYKPQNKKEQQFTNTLQHLGAFKVMAYRHRRKHHHQYNSQYIL